MKYIKISKCKGCGGLNRSGGDYCEECLDDTGDMAQGPSYDSGEFDWARRDHRDTPPK